MMDDRLTADIQAWLELKPETRDLRKGAEMLLQLTGSQVMFRNICRNLPAYGQFLEIQLSKHLKFRLERITHSVFVSMEKEAQKAMERNFSSVPPDPDEPPKRGRRKDHDRLPYEIRQLFELNMQDRRRMAECHMQLRKLSGAALTCPDSDRFPFVKELIRLDKLCIERWRRYDEAPPA